MPLGGTPAKRLDRGARLIAFLSGASRRVYRNGPEVSLNFCTRFPVSTSAV
jgi:hypothetical protein